MKVNEIIDRFWVLHDEHCISINSTALFFYLTTSSGCIEKYNVKYKKVLSTLNISLNDFRFCVNELNYLGVIKIRFDVGADTFSYSINYIDKSIHINNGNNVYVFKVGDSNVYKIGVTKNIDKRIKQIESLIGGWKLTCIFSIKKDHAYKVESYIHSLISSNRLHGEFFELQDDELSAVIYEISNCII